MQNPTNPDTLPALASGADTSRAFHTCLGPLLEALQWEGAGTVLQGAMPSSGMLPTLLDLRTVLFRLGFSSAPSAVALDRLSDADLPCLFVPSRYPGECWVVLEHRPDGRLRVYSGRRERFHDVEPASLIGRIYAVKPIDTLELPLPGQSWIRYAVSQESGMIGKLVLLTFLINIMAVLLSVYVMTVYDKVVTARSNMTLGFLFVGILLSVALEFTLRQARARGLAYLGARMESVITLSALERVLHLPASAVEQSSLSTQISRLKTFESVRDAFSGQIASTLLDLPFILLFIGVVFLIGGSVGWIVVAFAVVMAVLVMIYGPIARLQSGRVARANAERRQFLGEVSDHLETIRNCHVEDVWLRRSHVLSVAQLKATASLQRLKAAEQSLSHILFLLAGTSIVFYGATRVMSGDMTAGALVALMALTWRVLSPVQAVFLTFTKLGQIRDVFRQVDNLMRLPVEYEPGKASMLPRKFIGGLAAEGVVFRFPNRPEPTLRGATLLVRPGQCVALAGTTGSGKSTLMKLFAGLYPIQAGGVYIDGLDLRQVDARDLRQNLSYLEEKNHVFTGSLAQNLRLACPEASDDDVLEALVEFGVLPPDAYPDTINASVGMLTSDSLLRRFALARVFIKRVPIYLLDEPSLFLDAEADAVVRRKISALRGKATILLATVQPAYMRLATRVVVMQAGRIGMEGPPEAVIPILLNQSRQGAPGTAKASLPRQRKQAR
jgi:ABC-type bacteriocin/lantibiotic exporter with double-glycine peptidase domain